MATQSASAVAITGGDAALWNRDHDDGNLYNGFIHKHQTQHSHHDDGNLHDGFIHQRQVYDGNDTTGIFTTVSSTNANFNTATTTTAIFTNSSSSIATDTALYASTVNVTATSTLQGNSMYGTSTFAANVNENHSYSGATTSILFGGSTVPACFEIYDAAASTTLDYVYISSTALVVTTTKPTSGICL